jgi:hypothetical protein
LRASSGVGFANVLARKSAVFLATLRNVSSQVSHVVHLEVGPIREGLGVFAVPQRDEHGRVNVAVGALGAGDGVDRRVEDLFQLGIVVERPDGGYCFEELVVVTIIKRGAVVVALHVARGDQEVLVVRLVLVAAHEGRHGRQRVVTKRRITVGPEAFGPANFVDADGVDLGRGALGNVGNVGGAHGERQKRASDDD